MTSDGIDKNDWEGVIDLSAKIANAVCSDDEVLAEALITELLRTLDTLEAKYGRLPGILATKADYIDNPIERMRLLQQAWQVANERCDRANLVHISSSLAEWCIEELNQMSTGEKWLDHLEDSLEDYWDDDEYQELQRLKKAVAAQ